MEILLPIFVLSVSINHGPKQVIDISHQINLVAMNAILVAKRAINPSGFQSCGDGVGGSQSEDGRNDVASWRNDLPFAKRIADLRKQRNVHLLGSAIKKFAAAAMQLEQSFQLKNEQYAHLSERVNQEWRSWRAK